MTAPAPKRPEHKQPGRPHEPEPLPDDQIGFGESQRRSEAPAPELQRRGKHRCGDARQQAPWRKAPPCAFPTEKAGHETGGAEGCRERGASAGGQHHQAEHSSHPCPFSGSTRSTGQRRQKNAARRELHQLWSCFVPHLQQAQCGNHRQHRTIGQRARIVRRSCFAAEGEGQGTRSIGLRQHEGGPPHARQRHRQQQCKRQTGGQDRVQPTLARQDEHGA